MAKLAKMQRFLPSLYRPTTNVNVKGLLYSWSSEDDQIVQAVKDAKEQLFVKYAQLRFLDALGSNVGVFRPSEFNLADEQFRELVPALSFYPKQVVPTIKKVLDVFYGANNPRVAISEVNPNEIVIQIPSSVPALRRSLKGSNHFHNYYGAITSIDNTFKTMTIDLYGSTKSLKVDELAGAFMGQGNIDTVEILSNTAGTSSVIIQFSATSDISSFTLGMFNICNVVRYQGSFVPDPNALFTVTKQRGTIAQNIVAGNIYPILTMQDASRIPDAPGFLVFNFGRAAQEGVVKYFGRPNNTTLLLDASYSFTGNHSIGDVVNVVVKPYKKPTITGDDYAVYLVGVTAARILAQKIVQSIAASGVVIRWIILEPEC